MAKTCVACGAGKSITLEGYTPICGVCFSTLGAEVEIGDEVVCFDDDEIRGLVHGVTNGGNRACVSGHVVPVASLIRVTTGEKR